MWRRISVSMLNRQKNKTNRKWQSSRVNFQDLRVNKSVLVKPEVTLLVNSPEFLNNCIALHMLLMMPWYKDILPNNNGKKNKRRDRAQPGAYYTLRQGPGPSYQSKCYEMGSMYRSRHGPVCKLPLFQAI